MIRLVLACLLLLALAPPAGAGSGNHCILFDDVAVNLASNVADVTLHELTDSQMSELRRQSHAPFVIERAVYAHSPTIRNDDGVPVLLLLIEIGGCTQQVGEFTPTGLRSFVGEPVEVPE